MDIRIGSMPSAGGGSPTAIRRIRQDRDGSPQDRSALPGRARIGTHHHRIDLRSLAAPRRTGQARPLLGPSWPPLPPC